MGASSHFAWHGSVCAILTREKPKFGKYAVHYLENALVLGWQLYSEFPRYCAQMAEHVGVSRAKICYYVSLVEKLPEKFVEWLRSCDDPGMLGYFTDQRLPEADVRSDKRVCLFRWCSRRRRFGDFQFGLKLVHPIRRRPQLSGSVQIQ